MLQISDRGHAQSVRYTEQFLGLPQQSAAVDNWRDTDDEKYSLPAVMALTQEESDEYTRIMTNANTLKGEKFVKYIQGTESIDTWDSYIDELKNMGIERAIEIEQAAYERFLSR